MKKNIAISMRVVTAQEHDEKRDAISHDWICFMNRMNYSPVLIPNSLIDPAAYIADKNIEGIILSNGDDVKMNQTGGGIDLSGEREKTEKILLDYAVSNEIPVIGVCRGFQFINLYFSGTLRRIDSFSDYPERHVSSNHKIKIVGNNILGLSDKHLIVNSYHNYGITPADISLQLKAFAFYEEDGVCEGIYHPELPVLGIQWHPERPNKSSKADMHLFSAIMEQKNIRA